MAETEYLLKTESKINPSYKLELEERYGAEIAETIAEGWRHADLPEQPGEQIDYLRLNEGVSEKPVIYIPGFTEGIMAKAPFAADLSNRGFDVVLPDQNREGILINPSTGKKDATYTQAVNYLAVLEAEDIEQADFVTHSYGSLILEEMFKIAESRGQHIFDDSKVIMLAPAGFDKGRFKRTATLLPRFGAMLASERDASTRRFPDQPEMLKAGTDNLKANLPRTVAEGLDLASHELDLKKLQEKLGSLTVLSYAKDKLYSDKVLAKGMQEAVEEGVAWAVPITEDGETYEGKPDNATHNDEQFNPARVSASVAELLR